MVFAKFEKIGGCQFFCSFLFDKNINLFSAFMNKKDARENRTSFFYFLIINSFISVVSGSKSLLIGLLASKILSQGKLSNDKLPSLTASKIMCLYKPIS